MTEDIFNRLQHSEFRRRFHLKQTDIVTLMILLTGDWRRPKFQMTENKRRCEGIRFLSHNMPPQPAVDNVFTNGTGLPPVPN